jgi:hypothetical protein
MAARRPVGGPFRAIAIDRPLKNSRICKIDPINRLFLLHLKCKTLNLIAGSFRTFVWIEPDTDGLSCAITGLTTIIDK